MGNTYALCSWQISYSPELRPECDGLEATRNRSNCVHSSIVSPPDLNQLCGAGAARNTGQPGDATTHPDGDDADGDADDDEEESTLRTEAERSAMKATVLKVAINLTNEGLLGARDASAVNGMITRQHPVLVAAFKVT